MGAAGQKKGSLPLPLPHSPQKSKHRTNSPLCLENASPAAAAHERDTQSCLHTEVSHPTHTRVSSKCAIQAGRIPKKLPQKIVRTSKGKIPRRYTKGFGPGIPEPTKNQPLCAECRRHELPEAFQIRTKDVLGGLTITNIGWKEWPLRI